MGLPDTEEGTCSIHVPPKFEKARQISAKRAFKHDRSCNDIRDPSASEC
jgi:hypothetical protein